MYEGPHEQCHDEPHEWQRWANSVLMTEYEYEYYSTFQKWPNTNTNILRFEKCDRIWIRILFGLKISTEYEYEYYSVWKYRPNTNTNIIWFEKITRIRIRILVFGLKYSNNIRILNYSLTSGCISFCSHCGTILLFEIGQKGQVRILCTLFWSSVVSKVSLSLVHLVCLRLTLCVWVSWITLFISEISIISFFGYVQYVQWQYVQYVQIISISFSARQHIYHIKLLIHHLYRSFTITTFTNITTGSTGVQQLK